jgi:hypothetical protein
LFSAYSLIPKHIENGKEGFLFQNSFSNNSNNNNKKTSKEKTGGDTTGMNTISPSSNQPSSHPFYYSFSNSMINYSSFRFTLKYLLK